MEFELTDYAETTMKPSEMKLSFTIPVSDEFVVSLEVVDL